MRKIYQVLNCSTFLTNKRKSISCRGCDQCSERFPLFIRKKCVVVSPKIMPGCFSQRDKNVYQDGCSLIANQLIIDVMMLWFFAIPEVGDA